MKTTLFCMLLVLSALLNAQEFDSDQFFNEELIGLSQTDQFDRIAFHANELYDVDMNASMVLIDSLKAYAKRMNLNAERQLTYIMVLVDVYMAAGEMKLAEEYISQLFTRLNSLNVEVPERHVEMNIYERLASYARLQTRLDSALYYYDKELNIALSMGDTLTVMNAYNGKGLVYETLGIYDLAIENLFEVVKIAEGLNDKKGIIVSYNNLGLIHQENGNYQTGREYLLKGLSLIEGIGWESEKGYAYGNLGYNYFYAAEYEKALEYALKSQESFEEFGFEAELTLLNALRGRIYVALDKVELGDHHLDMALNMANPQEFVEAYIEVLFGKSQVAKAGRDYPMAETNLLEALQISKANDLNKLRLTSMGFLVNHYDDRKAYAKAFKMQQLLTALNDSIFNVRKNFQISDLQTRYETAEKEEAIIQGSLDLEKQKARTNIIVIVLVLAVLLICVMVYFYRQVQRARNQLKAQNKVISDQNKELDVLNSTKDKFFSIIAHDLRSPMIGLQGVGQKLEYFIKKDKQEKLLEMGSQIDQSIDQLNHLLNNLLNWAASQTGGIPHHPDTFNVNTLIDENIELYLSLAVAKEVTVVNQGEKVNAYADVNAISTILRNLLSNAIKFAPSGGQVTITTEQVNHQTVIRIKDEGPGMEAGRRDSLFNGEVKSAAGTQGEKGFGLGLKLCKEFAEMNAGHIEVSSKVGSGSEFKVLLPSSENSQH